MRGRWDYVLVDEFQDLSLAQYEVVTRPRRRAPQLLRRGRRRAVDLLLDRRRSGDPGALPDRLRHRRADHPRPEPPLLPADLRDRAPAGRPATPGCSRSGSRRDRESEHCVAAHALRGRTPKAEWLVADLLRDRAESGLAWGDYGVLYRYHRIGQAARDPADRSRHSVPDGRGQALLDDELIGSIVASLRDHPDARRSARRSRRSRSRCCRAPLLDRVRASFRDSTSLTALRAFARTARGDPDARLGLALRLPRREPRRPGPDPRRARAPGRRAARAAPRAATAIRSTSGRRSSAIPRTCPVRPHLAERLAETRDRGAAVWVEPDRGSTSPCSRCSARSWATGCAAWGPPTGPPPEISCCAPEAPGRCSLFKALQLLQCRGLADPLQDYVAFDLETTEMDVADCEIVELAAVRVRGRVIVDQFQRLIRTARPISPRATAVHGYRDADVCDQPTFARGLAGVPRVRRAPISSWRTTATPSTCRCSGGSRPACRASTSSCSSTPSRSPARSWTTAPDSRISPTGSALPPGARTMPSTTRARSRASRGTWASSAWRAPGRPRLVQLLGWLGLALALDAPADPTPEERLLRELALPAALGRYGGCLEAYAEQAAGTGAPSVDELIERLGGSRLLERIRTERPVAERYPASAARLAALVAASAAPTPGREHRAAARPRGAVAQRRLPHRRPAGSACSPCMRPKGLEFSRVYIVGAEDNQLPGYRCARGRRPERDPGGARGCSTSA